MPMMLCVHIQEDDLTLAAIAKYKKASEMNNWDRLYIIIHVNFYKFCCKNIINYQNLAINLVLYLISVNTVVFKQ